MMTNVVCRESDSVSVRLSSEFVLKSGSSREFSSVVKQVKVVLVASAVLWGYFEAAKSENS
jgi:hypothetical protein